MSGCAFLAASANRIALSRKWWSPKASRGPALIVSVHVSVGSVGEIIGVHLWPEQSEQGTLSWLNSISDWSELLATICGVVTATGSYVDDPEKIGITVAAITGTIDVIATGISVLGGELVPSPFLPARHVSLMPLLISGAKAPRAIVRVEANHNTSYYSTYRTRTARGMNLSKLFDHFLLGLSGSPF